VQVHYTGWTTDGESFDSSIGRGRPSVFPLSRVITGWTEGLQLMVEGEKRRFWIPEALAYRGQTGRPAGTLVFDIELLEIQGAPQMAPNADPSPFAAPPDVAAPPEHAEHHKSGLAWVVLKEGHGTRNPKVAQEVTVHYTGWTTDGRLFDSSVRRGKPSRFSLNQVIRGWSQGLGLMVEGEKRRFWIPQKLAYRGQPGRPAGMLVFDVELLEIH
jgi:peptidylprolyl isomerase